MSESCELLCLDLARAEALRRGLPSVEALDVAAQRAKGLADPTRLRLAVALREGGEMCVCDLAWIGERSDKLVSHHLRVLRQAGLARSRKDGRMTLYALTPEGSAMLDAITEAAVAR